MCMQEGDYMRAHLPPNSLGVNHQSLLASANFQAWPKRSHFCPLRTRSATVFVASLDWFVPRSLDVSRGVKHYNICQLL